MDVRQYVRRELNTEAAGDACACFVAWHWTD
jgi:hypothetical protein